MHITPQQLSLRLNHKRYHSTYRTVELNSSLSVEVKQFLDEWYNESTYILAQTSGTTGPAKNIRLEKDVMLRSAKKTCDFFSIKASSTLLLALSPKHIAGKMMLVRAMLSGANLLTADQLSHPLNKIDRTIDFAALVPLQLTNHLNHSEVFKHISTVLIGGAPLSDVSITQIQNISTVCYQSYGMTETASHVAIRKLNGTNHSDMYTAFPGVSFKTNTEDQLIIDAPDLNVKGLLTNDLVELIDTFHFRWIGRADNVINSGGIKLFPEKIERKLKNLLTSEFYISSEPDALLGEKVVLIMEEKDKRNENELKLLFEKHLDRYEKPREIRYVNKIELTTLGKIIRQ